MGPCGLSRLWQQNYNLKIKSCLDEAVQILQSFQLSVEQEVALSSAGRKGAKKRKRERLGPFSNPHEVPVQEAVRNHRACKFPAGICARRFNQLATSQFTPWSPVRAAPPSTATELCSLWRVAEQTAGVKGV